MYTIDDPRAVLLHEKASKLTKEKSAKRNSASMTLSRKFLPTCLPKCTKVKKKICPNVDFYSGFVYSMLNIPRELYTPIFAISRIAGWSAHRIEEIVAGGRIYRPAYKNVGGVRDYVPIEKRIK